MEARLVKIVGSRRGDEIPIDADEYLIGRDPSSDLVLEYARISRAHASIRSMGERHTLCDLGSTNGTLVNGRPVGAEPVLLEHGDVIDLAGEVAVLYERGDARGTSTPWVALAGAMVAVLAVAIALVVWRTRPAPDLGEAYALARRGHVAALAGDPLAAKNDLQEAAGMLWRSGQLDDVPRGDVMKVAMQRLGEPLGPGVDLWAQFQHVLDQAQEQRRTQAAQNASPASDGPGDACRLDRVPASQLEACLRVQIEEVLKGLKQEHQEGVPDSFHREVAERLRKEHDFLARSLERGRPYVPMIRAELERQRMPPLLHYLALIESGYDANAVSPARAVGLWQFMPRTARQYKLVVDGSRDDRRDPAKSTRAAARYLRDLAFEFGGDALLLALAGYNRGENGVRRALKKLDDPFSDRSYWRLVERGLLPKETAKYVPRFVAAAVAGEAGLPDPATLEEAGY